MEQFWKLALRLGAGDMDGVTTDDDEEDFV